MLTILAQSLKVLFLHPNFPAQFKHLAKAAGINGNDVKFLCQTHFGRELAGVNRITLKNQAGYDELEKKNLPIFERSQALAKQYRKGFTALKNSNWHPDIVISHSGWGCSLFLKEVWPKCMLISYLEWWFDPQSTFFSYDAHNTDLNINRNTALKSWLRNQQVALELAISDSIVAPTTWQRDQLPITFHERCLVIFDGIDLNKFKKRSDTDKNRESILTYGTRGMDPMRCFPQFIKELPMLLDFYPKLKVEIAGQDKSHYGKTEESKGISWGTWAKSYLKKNGLETRVDWLGNLPPTKYERWLTTSQSHVYLTHPFIASWSLVESYCSNIPIITSYVEPVTDICKNHQQIYYVDHRKKGFLLNAYTDLQSERDHSSNKDTRTPAKFGIPKMLKRWELVSGLDLTTTG